jgi:dTDP-4-dehydrorhamnose 3,5-epimerase
VHADTRGHFLETWNQRTLAALGIDAHFVQENLSRSVRGVLRGLHYQAPHAQGKLLRVLSGVMYDVVVDLRRASATFGQWRGLHLRADEQRTLWVPPGLAHGFLALSEQVEVLYAVTDYYAPEAEHTLLWNDPALGIEWPLAEAGVDTPLLSPKDALGAPLARARLFEAP